MSGIKHNYQFSSYINMIFPYFIVIYCLTISSKIIFMLLLLN